MSYHTQNCVPASIIFCEMSLNLSTAILAASSSAEFVKSLQYIDAGRLAVVNDFIEKCLVELVTDGDSDRLIDGGIEARDIFGCTGTRKAL